MKVMAFYIDKKYFAEKLGIEESQLVMIGDVTSSFDAIDFKVFIDNDAEIKSSKEFADLDGSQWNIRRHRLDSLGDE